MNPLTSISASGATSALKTLQDLAEAQDANSLTSSASAEKHSTLSPTENSYGPAVINEVQDIRKKFSDLEIRTVGGALGSYNAGATPETRTQTLDSVLGRIASMRDKGEDVYLIVTWVKDQGSAVMVMSGSEFAAALDSDDPNSLGSFKGADGKTVNFKDLIKQLSGLSDEMDSFDPKLSVARGVIRSLRSSDKGAPLEESKSLKLEADKSMLAPEFRSTDYSINIVRFKAISEKQNAKENYNSLGVKS